jgi:SAM-dependent methyltransferase
MAVNGGAARLLLAEHAKAPFSGVVLQLGRQNVTLTGSQLRSWARKAGVNLREKLGAPDKKVGADGKGPLGWMDDRTFFHSLGFDEVLSCDVSDYEGADVVCDLNVPVPKALTKRFDVIFNGGTIEHIFNIPIVLANIHAMLKVGGRVIHVAPSSSLIDHGFYSLSPTLFLDYYVANRYVVSTAYLFEFYDWTTRWSVYEYLPGCFDGREDKFVTHKKVGFFCIAEKTMESTADAVPVQSCYHRLWQNDSKGPNARKGRLAANFVKTRFPGIAELLLWGLSQARQVPFRRRLVMPRFVGRF